MNNRFDPGKLNKLNNPARLDTIPPEYIWNVLNLKEVSTIVDIGAGTGFFSIPFQKLSGAVQVYACDISKTMINWMNENIVPENPAIIPLKMDSMSIPLTRASAELVYMINLHHELDEPLAVLREAKRLLKDGGKIFISDWKKEVMNMGPPYQIRYSTEKLSLQLKNAGFNNISIDNSLEKNFLIIAEV